MQDSNLIGQNVWERRFILQNKSVARAKTTRLHFWMFFSRSNVMNHNLEYSRIITNLDLLIPIVKPLNAQFVHNVAPLSTVAINGLYLVTNLTTLSHEGTYSKYNL